jgi:hypothetical protein
MQASVAVNELLGIGESLSGWMFMFNALNFITQKVRIHKKKDCPVCSGNIQAADSIPMPKTTTCLI